ncbi:mechanosensitive ion channel protein MscS [Flavobacterium cyanobacteriorum]|uniref:Mechanosensitive ion channel protein MscS n=1 Tax=Flavobacterium cyanobacteriorum TaxID=2022802 RepID=A0A255YX27_9FLAO|nr:mechanosensitive ion channel family protein [Flavobacterium cyanobacteriorum]OYQ33215.1 mechanosensitive ion channel protein MscS [Flavobacterium cyanobacteriorum]
MPTVARAQLPGNTEPAKEAAPEMLYRDSLGRETPRGTVSGFIKAMADRNYIRASNYLALDRARRKAKERERIAKTLQHLLDQGGSIMPTSWLSSKSTGRTDDDIQPGTDLVGSVTVDGEAVNLYVENVASNDKTPLWLFSAETVQDISSATIEELWLDQILPKPLKESFLGGVPVGHWLAMILLIVFSYIAAWAAIYTLLLIIRLFWGKARTEPTKGVISAFGLPFRLYLAVWVFIFLSQSIGISIIIRQRFSSITVTIAIVAVLILLWRLTDYISTYSKNRMSRRGRISAISIILFLRRTAKVVFIVLGIISILSAIGVDVTTWLAALGIGGIALALGAQKAVENFVGSVTLITDQPVRVGDFCKVGDVSGTVEQIGMRSTHIRTGERTLVTIPNGDLSASRIENFAHRDRYLFDPVFELRLDTTPDQVRFLLVELRALLYSHPKVNPDPAKLRFTGVTTTSLKLEFWAYIEAPNFDTFQEIQEDLLLRMMDIVTTSGTAFAMPSQHIFIARDKGLPEEKVAKAAETVKQWSDAGELQLPKFDPKKINELKGTVAYPPEGSYSAKKVNGL